MADSIAVDLRYAAYCTTVRLGSQADWDAIYAKYKDAGPLHLPNATYERATILKSLTCSTDNVVLRQ